MQVWYYSDKGERKGPVSFEELQNIARSGNLNPQTDLGWTEGMAGWTPLGQVPGVFVASGAVAGAYNPYSAPITAPHDLLASHVGESLPEIPPGSYDMDLMAIIKRAVTLTKRHAWKLIVIGSLYFLSSAIVELLLAQVDKAMGWTTTTAVPAVFGPEEGNVFYDEQQSLFSVIVSWAFSTLIGLGLARVALNVVSGLEFRAAMLFLEGNKLLRAIGATILYGLMVAVGLLLLIVPGIWLALRFSMYQYAIVDRNLGIIDSFKYSSSLTTNNRLNLFGLGILCMLIVLAGALALLVGLVFAIPVVTLVPVVAYRCLQFGPRAMEDHPGTEVPVLKNNFAGGFPPA